jgi:hypothetical protein
MGWLILGLAIFYWYSKRDLKRHEKSLYDMPIYEPEEKKEPPVVEAPDLCSLDEARLN